MRLDTNQIRQSQSSIPIFNPNLQFQSSIPIFNKIFNLQSQI